MSDPWPFIIVIIVLAFIGALISLSALLPPVRRLCRRSLAARGVAICTVGAVSFVIGFGLLTRLNAEVSLPLWHHGHRGHVRARPGGGDLAPGSGGEQALRGARTVGTPADSSRGTAALLHEPGVGM